MTLINPTHTAPSAWQQLITMPTARKLLYFCAVPVLIGLYFGWFKADQGGQDVIVRVFLVPYWIGFFLLGWLSVIVATLLGFEIMKPWRPSLWFVSMLAPAAFSWIGAYAINVYIEFFNSLMPEVIGKSTPLVMDLSLDFAINFLSFMAPNLVLFTAQNYYFDRSLKQPVYRYELPCGDAISPPPKAEPQKQTPTAKPEPAFLNLLSPKNQGSLQAVQAQEHFIKVWTETGSELIRYKFGRAIVELEDYQGMQIHRSYWVADNAVRQLKKDGSKYFIELINDETIPISQSYLRQVRERYADR